MTKLLEAVTRRPDRRPRVLALVDLVQDIDVMLPVLLAIRAEDRCALDIRVSRWLARESPRTANLLHVHGLPFASVRRSQVIAGAAPSLRGVAAVLCASESDHPAHAAGHALAMRARAAGLRAYGLQHGFENAGLFGLEAAGAAFASDVVFCWFPPAATPAALTSETRAKLAHLGRPAPPGGWRRPGAARFDLAVFENLHWDRYGEADRRGFLQGLAATARALPTARILVRPHPAGGWADRVGHELAQFGNITPARASDARRERDGGAEVLQGVKRVITTPSTIALDAALAGIPVALAAPGGPVYAPLPVLQTPHDWIDFAAGGPYAPGTLDLFVSRVLVAGDGAPRIAGRLSRDLMGHSAHLDG